ncbi:Spermine oxidase [Papilio machaon]|uniref:Spermine oxidase n=1 Tax=Papilio machaon TaxID=76193 RepID=A0A0N0PF98_PAPMA|nr:Spermine oxidase [Papilio machaon]
MSWHRNGYKTFFELLLNTYKGGPGLANLNIKLNTEVTKITWPQKPLTPVEVTCKNGEVYRANNVIVTVSIGVLKERYMTLFVPSLPEEKALAIQRLSMGVVDKVVISYLNKWWPNSNVYWFNQTKQERDRAVKDNGWVTYFASVPFGSGNTITLWYSGDAAKLVSIVFFLFLYQRGFMDFNNFGPIINHLTYIIYSDNSISGFKLN